MAVFKSAMRGPAAAAARAKVLRAFADLGLIEYGRPVVSPEPRKPTQYLVRMADPVAPWRLMDGKELMPWLLGITEAAATGGGDEAAVARMWAILKPYMGDADPVLPAHLAELAAPGSAAS